MWYFYDVGSNYGGVVRIVLNFNNPMSVPKTLYAISESQIVTEQVFCMFACIILLKFFWGGRPTMAYSRCAAITYTTCWEVYFVLFLENVDRSKIFF